MKTNGVLLAIATTIIGKIEAVSLPKKETNGKKVEPETPKDPKQDALNELFAVPDVFSGYVKDARKLVEILTGLKIADPTKVDKFSTRYLVVIPDHNRNSMHDHTIGQPMVTITKTGHGFELTKPESINGCHKTEVRPATPEEIKNYIAALKADVESDDSKFMTWLAKFEVRSLME